MNTEPTATTRPTGPVVVGIDFSKHSAHAVEYAAAEAQRHRLPLVLVHAIDSHAAPATYLALTQEELTDQAQGELADQAAALHEDFPALTVRTSIVIASPADALVDASTQASMVVVGSRGHGSLGQVLLGSVAWRVVSRAHGPVVLVRPDDSVRADAAGQVLVGVDGSESSAAAIEFAFAEAQARGRGLVAVTVWALPQLEGLAIGRTWSSEPAEWQEEMRSDAARVLSEALAGKAERYPDVPVHEVVIHGLNIPQTLLEVASTTDAELVVVGARGHNPLAELVLGAVGVQLSHYADRTIAVVHG